MSITWKAFHLSVTLVMMVSAEKLNPQNIKELFEDEFCIDGELVVDSFGDFYINGFSRRRDHETEEVAKPVGHPTNIVTALFPDAQNDVKPAAAILNDALTKQGIETLYTLVKKEGPDHNPLFTVILTAGINEFHGTGRSIRAAKNDAAQYAINSKTFLIEESDSKQEKFEALTPVAKINNLAMKLNMKIEFIKVVHQPEEQSTKSKKTINLGSKSSYEKRLNKTVFKEYGFEMGRVSTEEDTSGPFTIQLNVGTKTFLGNGLSMQAAKHNAAEKAINAFRSVSIEEAVQCSKDESCKAKKPATSILNELEQRKEIQEVQYSLLQESGLAHKKEFEIRCQIGEMFADGSAGSKKAAKELAAQSMLRKLEHTIPDQSAKRTHIEGTPLKKKKKGKSKINKSAITRMQFNMEQKVASTFNYLISDHEENHNQLKDTKKPNVNNDDDLFTSRKGNNAYAQMLLLLLDEHKIKSLIRRISSDAGFVSLIDISTKPNLVCYGLARSEIEADDNAAYHALDLLNKDSTYVSSISRKFDEMDYMFSEDTITIDIQEKDK